MGARLRLWTGATLVAFLVGAAMRISNAFRYPIGFGFDSNENWNYIHSLLHSWALPAPDAGWSTAHPPLFYYLAALVGRLLGWPEKEVTVVAVRVLCSAVGLLAIMAGVALVRRVDPDNHRRAWLCGALILFLPAHIYVSAMLSEEVLMASFASFALVVVSLALAFPSDSTMARWRAALVGVLAGLALLTKLTGAVVLIAVVLAYLIDGWRRGRLAIAWPLATIAGVAGLLVGGWFFARNLVQYGYVYPRNLPVHAEAIERSHIPPGERHLVDYVYFPVSTFTHPFLASPDLVRSVWGSAYSTLWYDSHLHFLPRYNDAARNLGRLLLLLALLPTTAFLVGFVRALRRVVRGTTAVDLPMVLMIVGTLSGFALFAWKNPWYFAVKGSYLLSMALPAAYYASEVLADWTRGKGWRPMLISAALGALFIAVFVTFTFGLAFTKTEPPGVGPFWPSLSWR